VLKPGASVHVFEGDHGSVLAWPDDPAIQRLVGAVSQHQSLQGGDAYIGRRLYPILSDAGFENVRVEPYMADADGSRPNWIDEFTQATFIDMMRGQEEAVLERGLLTEREWQAGMTALSRTATIEGTFCYTFFRATAQSPASASR
jgi:hypothetical protein